MKSCINCHAAIDEHSLGDQLEPLRDLTAEDFNLCAECATIVTDACVVCGGAVYVPSASEVPDYCPACRSELINRTGRDPGWQSTPLSS